MTNGSDNLLGKLQTMARMQEGFNQKLHEQWEQQGYEFYRAIWIECGEMLDHFGWKWWKHTEPDLDQVKLELVDIWHFGMSDLLRKGQTVQDWSGPFQELQSADEGAEAFRQTLERFAARTLQDRAFSLPAFIELMAALPMTADNLFELYVGKNVLNGFRQDHGYRSGEYRKLWAGREDNEHLIDALAELHCAPEALEEALYAALKLRYDGAA